MEAVFKMTLFYAIPSLVRFRISLLPLDTMNYYAPYSVIPVETGILLFHLSDF